MKDVGAGLESIANTLGDGVVDEHELNNTIPKLKAVIRECASVKYLLETLYKNRKRKTRKQAETRRFDLQLGDASRPNSRWGEFHAAFTDFLLSQSELFD